MNPSQRKFGDDEIAAAWQQEIKARLQKIASGNFQAPDWRQALQDIHQELKKEETCQTRK